ncbi:discoidin domain-containing protein [Chitiniphilus eburneus]|nr:discoidin domain-containing protein [Chitiniphilus eburneus]
MTPIPHPCGLDFMRLAPDLSGYGQIAGDVAIAGTPETPARRLVRLHRRDTGAWVADTLSAEDGQYRFALIDPALEYYVVAFDGLAAVYNAEIADRVIPVSAAPAPPANTGRYWRIHITATNGGTASIQEIELRATPGGADLTTPATPVTASSQYSGNQAVAAVDNLFDSNVRAWVASSANLPQWLTFDLGTAVTVAEVAIAARNHPSGPVSAPRDFTIQYSRDGDTWSTAASYSGVGAWQPGTDISVGKRFAVVPE